jgi:indolepyruvate ferredoxin oxidoreductase alpha subunit
MDILSKKIGEKILLLGNDAIVRGALEAGVQFVSTYPGTPASEIGNTFYKIAKQSGVYFRAKRGKKGLNRDLYFEFSVNEKVAMEAGMGACFSGMRTLVAMKNFGLNVASDALLPLVYSGVKGGLVIAVADDPGCSSSAQSEQNTRAFAEMAHIPILEPADVQECRDFTKLAFEISEKHKIPVMIRETTRVALQVGPVKTGKIVKNNKKAKFIKDPNQFITMPPRVLEMKKELLEKIERIRELSEKSTLNQIKSKCQNPKFGIITAGVSFLYVMEALKELKLNLPVLKLGFFNPLPEKKIKSFIKPLKKVLIVEELEPYLEKEVNILAKEVNPKLKVIGKELLPEVGELRPEMILSAIAKTINRKLPTTNYKLQTAPARRSPQLCPGCPYWLVFSGIKNGIKQAGLKQKNIVFGGEIGCYMLAGVPPHNLQDYLFCMGSSVGIAHGILKANNKQKLISFVGDSSFFHSGIPPLINAVYNKSNPLIIIMNNGITAMTGQQPHPGVDGIKIEEIVRACGVKNMAVIDPVKQKQFIALVKKFLNKKQVSVIIARRPCIRI